MKDLLDMDHKNCLNNFASINLNIKTSHLNHSWETLLEKEMTLGLEMI